MWFASPNQLLKAWAKERIVFRFDFCSLFQRDQINFHSRCILSFHLYSRVFRRFCQDGGALRCRAPSVPPRERLVDSRIR
jgi:hypothetical protein